MENYTYILYEGIEEIFRGTRSEVFARIGEYTFSTWEDETRGMPKITIERGQSRDEGGNLVASYVVYYDASDSSKYRQFIVRRITDTNVTEAEASMEEGE